MRPIQKRVDRKEREGPRAGVWSDSTTNLQGLRFCNWTWVDLCRVISKDPVPWISMGLVSFPALGDIAWALTHKSLLSLFPAKRQGWHRGLSTPAVAQGPHSEGLTLDSLLCYHCLKSDFWTRRSSFPFCKVLLIMRPMLPPAFCLPGWGRQTPTKVAGMARKVIGEGGQEAPRVAACQDKGSSLDSSVPSGFLTLLIPPSHYTSRLSAIRPVSTNFLVPGAEDFSHCGWIRSSDPLAWKQTNTIIGVDGWRSRPRKGLCALRWAHVWEQGEESETQWDEVSLITGGETRKSKRTNGKIAGRLVSA